MTVSDALVDVEVLAETVEIARAVIVDAIWEMLEQRKAVLQANLPLLSVVDLVEAVGLLPHRVPAMVSGTSHARVYIWMHLTE